MLAHNKGAFESSTAFKELENSPRTDDSLSNTHLSGMQASHKSVGNIR